MHAQQRHSHCHCYSNNPLPFQPVTNASQAPENRTRTNLHRPRLQAFRETFKEFSRCVRCSSPSHPENQPLRLEKCHFRRELNGILAHC